MKKTKKTEPRGIVRIPNQNRQGDVLLHPVNKIPSDAKAQAPVNGRVILAYGEVTGHAHAISAKDVVLMLAADGTRYLDVIADRAELRHEEHGAIALRGAYRVVQQREYEPAGIRNVAD